MHVLRRLSRRQSRGMHRRSRCIMHSQWYPPLSLSLRTSCAACAMRSRITTTTTTITTGIFFGGKSKRSACVLGPIEGRRTAHGEVSRPRLRSDPHRAHSPTSRARRLCFVCLSRPVFLLLLRRNFLSPPPVSSLSCLDEKQQLVLILFVHVRNKRELERMDLFDGWNSKNLISLILNLYIYILGHGYLENRFLEDWKFFFFSVKSRGDREDTSH